MKNKYLNTPKRVAGFVGAIGLSMALVYFTLPKLETMIKETKPTTISGTVLEDAEYIPSRNVTKVNFIDNEGKKYFMSSRDWKVSLKEKCKQGAPISVRGFIGSYNKVEDAWPVEGVEFPSKVCDTNNISEKYTNK